jgi:transposase
MMHLPASVRVYLCLTACDMRKSFDGLHALVREHLELDALAGHLFVFASRRRDRIKISGWRRAPTPCRWARVLKSAGGA